MAIGARLEDFDSPQQSLDLYCELLKMWRTDTKVNASLETLGARYEPSLSSKALEYTVKLKTRTGRCLCGMGKYSNGAMGCRECALKTQKDLQRVYSFYRHSPMIVKEYCSDFAAISCDNSVQWFEMIGDKSSALKQIEFVVRKMVPKFPPIAIHDIFSVLCPLIMVMKDHGLAREAKELLKKYVLERFTSLGLSSSTYWWVVCCGTFVYIFW